MTHDDEFIRLRHERALATTQKLREVWQNESHSTLEGSAAIQRALDDYNDAARALTEAWNQRESAGEAPG